MGFTGVIWLLRRTARLAADLRGGARSGPMAAASSHWSDLGVAFADASSELARIQTLLSEDWRGEAAQRALQNLRELGIWLDAMSTVVSSTALQAEGCASAYDVASVAMPTEAEIAAAQAMKAAGATAPGVAAGLAAAGESMERALDIRAAAAMVAYESACAPVAIPVDFPAPPTLTAATDAIRPAQGTSPTASSNGPQLTDLAAIIQPQAVGPVTVPAAHGAALPMSQLAAAVQGAAHISPAVHAAGAIAGVAATASTAAARLGTGAPFGSAVHGTLPAGSAAASISGPAPAPSTSRPPAASAVPPVAAASTGSSSATERQPVGGGSPGSASAIRDLDPRTARGGIGTPQDLAGIRAHTSPSGREPALSATSTALPASPLAARPEAPENDVSVRRTTAPQETFDAGPTGRLICPPVIGANLGR